LSVLSSVINRAVESGSRWSGSSRAPLRLKGWTFGALLLFDLTFYFDWALRWEHGFGFLRRGEWQASTAAFFAVWLLCVAWLVREGAGFVRHFGLTLFVFSIGCFVAGSGNPVHDWKGDPAYYPQNFLQYDRNFMIYATEAGLELAVVAAAAHGILGRSLAKHLRFPAPWSAERWLGAVGAAFLLLGSVLTEPPLDTTRVQQASRGFETLRAAISAGVLVLGGAFAAASVALFVRRRRFK